MFDLSDMKQTVQELLDAQVRLWAGLAFMGLAMVSIQYEERIAPSFERVSDGWSMAATDFSRRLTSFTL
ncbi:MAG: hypothetical protein K2X34_03710 [Hyphomonadaceae bacterium]|nr:hypothetical protein [Hyphomonadaceae bacterium]